MCGDISSDVIAQIGWHWTSILYFQVVGPHSFAYEALFKQVKTIIDIFMFSIDLYIYSAFHVLAYFIDSFLLFVM